MKLIYTTLLVVIIVLLYLINVNILNLKTGFIKSMNERILYLDSLISKNNVLINELEVINKKLKPVIE